MLGFAPPPGLTALLAPPRCSICGAACGAHELACGRCARALASMRPGIATVPGIGQVAWACVYEGVARELVAALKFSGRTRLAALAAEALTPLVDPAGSRAVVAVPPAPLRRRARGFDPAEAIALELAKELALPAARALRRSQGRRQVGRNRAERRGSPPRVWVSGAVPDRVLLVDDVLTTGATLGACATALRGAGCRELSAVVFARAA